MRYLYLILLFLSAQLSGQYVGIVDASLIPAPSGQAQEEEDENAYAWDTIYYLNFESATLGTGISLADAQTVWGSPNATGPAGFGVLRTVSIVDVPALDDGTGPATRVWRGYSAD